MLAPTTHGQSELKRPTESGDEQASTREGSDKLVRIPSACDGEQKQQIIDAVWGVQEEGRTKSVSRSVSYALTHLTQSSCLVHAAATAVLIGCARV